MNNAHMKPIAIIGAVLALLFAVSFFLGKHMTTPKVVPIVASVAHGAPAAAVPDLLTRTMCMSDDIISRGFEKNPRLSPAAQANNDRIASLCMARMTAGDKLAVHWILLNRWSMRVF